jgi:hypothetical protein
LLLPSDVVDHVLCWLQEHEEGINLQRLEALVSLYGLSARSYSIQLPPSYDVLLLKCISSQVRSHKLPSVIEPQISHRASMCHCMSEFEVDTSHTLFPRTWFEWRHKRHIHLGLNPQVYTDRTALDAFKALFLYGLRRVGEVPKYSVGSSCQGNFIHTQ